jgi:hypothetical protein
VPLLERENGPTQPARLTHRQPIQKIAKIPLPSLQEISSICISPSKLALCGFFGQNYGFSLQGIWKIVAFLAVSKSKFLTKAK